jgi:soluble P-type ATPase
LFGFIGAMTAWGCNEVVRAFFLFCGGPAGRFFCAYADLNSADPPFPTHPWQGLTKMSGPSPGASLLGFAVACLLLGAILFSVAGSFVSGIPGLGASRANCCCVEREPPPQGAPPIVSAPVPPPGGKGGKKAPPKGGRYVVLRSAATAGKLALAVACALAQHSLHPASRSLVRAQAPTESSTLLRCLSVKETAGQGVEGVLWEKASGQSPRQLGPLRLGSAAWCGVDAVQADPVTAEGVRVYVRDAQGWLATFVLGEALRPGAANVVAALQAQGIQVQLLSGDRSTSVAGIAQAVGIAVARGECSPADKLADLQALQTQGRVVAMVGDGLNDTPALAAAAVSFAFSATVAVSQVHADFVVLGQSLEAVLRTQQLAQRTMAIVRQNLWWALAYNAACVPAAVMGYVSPWLAGLGMALSSLLVVLNALRLARPVVVEST